MNPQDITGKINRCRQDNYSLVAYQKTDGINIPYCSKNMFCCEESSSYRSQIVCVAALNRDLKTSKGDKKLGLEKLLKKLGIENGMPKT